MPQIIDLHCHSTASDGSLTPTELILRAHNKGVKTLSLTDHDTIDGLTEAIGAANSVGLKLIKGIELSCIWNNVAIHILGYQFDVENKTFQCLLNQQKEARWQRANKIAEKLSSKGMPDLLPLAIHYQSNRFLNSNGPGRPHFAQAMIEQGYVKNAKEAFQKWLGAGKIGDIKQLWPSLEEVVTTLQQAGAWISLAHPYQYKLTRTKLCTLLREFITYGGQAIEVVNGFQVPDQVGRLANLARDFNLLASAGSDFHTPRAWGELGLYRALPEDLPLLASKLGMV